MTLHAEGSKRCDSCHLALGLSSGTLDPSSGYISSDSVGFSTPAMTLHAEGSKLWSRESLANRIYWTSMLARSRAACYTVQYGLWIIHSSRPKETISAVRVVLGSQVSHRFEASNCGSSHFSERIHEEHPLFSTDLRFFWLK